MRGISNSKLEAKDLLALFLDRSLIYWWHFSVRHGFLSSLFSYYIGNHLFIWCIDIRILNVSVLFFGQQGIENGHSNGLGFLYDVTGFSYLLLTKVKIQINKCLNPR